MKRVCVFCGSNPGARKSYTAAAAHLGQLIVARDIELVFGGGAVGLMGVIADSVLHHGGRAIGVIPEGLVARELAHRGVQDLRVVGSMHERKALMAELADGFIALPGGFGTFEEFCEILTWAQLGLHAKACGLLNVDSYYDPLVQLFDHGVTERFIPSEHRDWVLVDSDADKLLLRMDQFVPPKVEKWLSRRET